MQLIVTVGIALLILFGWLRLILALEIASTGRQIQILTEELASIERGNNGLRLKIATALSPERLARIAEELGYALYEPIYVPMPSPLNGQEGLIPVAQVSNIETPLAQSGSWWDLAGGELDILLETEAIP
jgi:hypothetical protein